MQSLNDKFGFFAWYEAGCNRPRAPYTRARANWLKGAIPCRRKCVLAWASLTS